MKHKRQKDEQEPKEDGNTSEIRTASIWVNPTVKSMKLSPVLSLTAEQLISALMEAEPPIVYSEHDSTKPLSEASMMTLLTNLADKELVHMINWAKRVPGRLIETLEIQFALFL